MDLTSTVVVGTLPQVFFVLRKWPPVDLINCLDSMSLYMFASKGVRWGIAVGSAKLMGQAGVAALGLGWVMAKAIWTG